MRTRAEIAQCKKRSPLHYQRGTFPIVGATLANPPAAYQPAPGESLAVIISGGNTTAVRFDR
jgi:hypothetical protein